MFNVQLTILNCIGIKGFETKRKKNISNLNYHVQNSTETKDKYDIRPQTKTTELQAPEFGQAGTYRMWWS